MRLFLDCEFDGFDGPLLSMALVGQGYEWYEVLPHFVIKDLWVEKNVIPVLNKKPIEKDLVQSSLQAFLSKFDHVEIVADWPDDIKYFCQFLITKPGYAINTPPLSFVLDRSIKYVSKIPHNALEDARGIMNSFKSEKTS